MEYTGPIADIHLHAHSCYEDTAQMLDALGDMRVTRANLLAITFIDTPFENNLTTLFAKTKYRRYPVHAFGGLYYHPELNHENMPFLKQAELLLAMGFDGIKLIEMKPNFRKYIGFGLDDPRYDEMFDMLEEKQVPIISHIADPDYFWDPARMTPEMVRSGWYYGGGDFLPRAEIYRENEARLRKNPKLRMILAHFGFMGGERKELTALMETYPNLGLDLTPGASALAYMSSDIEGWREFFSRYRERIFYGTDCTSGWNSYNAKVQETVRTALSHDRTDFRMMHCDMHMTGLELDEELQRVISYDNYFRMLPDAPKPVDLSLFEEHTETIIRAVAAQEPDSPVIPLLRNQVSELRTFCNNPAYAPYIF